MKYKGLGGTGLLVSKFALGTMIFRGKNFPMSVAMGALNKQDCAGREHFPFLNDNYPYSPSMYLKRQDRGVSLSCLLGCYMFSTVLTYPILAAIWSAKHTT